jgi:hypothetical protein
MGAISGNQGHSGRPLNSFDIGGDGRNQWQSVAISGTQRRSATISDDQRRSATITDDHRRSATITDPRFESATPTLTFPA